MKNSFNNQVQQVRDEVKDLRQKNKEPQHNPQGSTIPSGPPTYYYHPPPTSSPIDPYSHTANSTAGFAQTGAYPTLKIPNQEEQKQIFHEKVKSTATNLLGQDRLLFATNKSNDTITSERNARELLQRGAIVQLLSKNSRQLLQVVMTSNGVLAFDGNGASNSFNTYFTIEEGEKGRLRFHNNYNYLAVDGKQPCILSLPPGPKNNSNIDFRVQDISGNSELVAFESYACKNHFISILPNGHLKTTNIKDKNIDAQFSVVLVPINPQPMFPYQAQPFQQFNMNPHGGFAPNGANGFMPPHLPMYQPPPPPAPSPPVYSTQSSYNQPSTSSGLYPQFN